MSSSKKYDLKRKEEHDLIRNQVGMVDFTMGVIEITGTDAQKILNEICVNDIVGLMPGRVRYTSILNEKSEMIDDVTVYCFNSEKFWIVSGLRLKDGTLEWLEKYGEDKKVGVKDLSKYIAIWAIQGPDSRRVLASYLKEDITGLKYFGFMKNWAGDSPIIISRTGFTGELGYEIYATKNQIGNIVSDLMEVGKKYGLKVLNTDVVINSIPQEKGMIIFRDFNGANPLEIGMEWSIKWDKSFIGKECLLKIREEGVKRRLMGFVAKDDDIDIEPESLVLVEEKIIGKVTSSSYGYTVKQNIGYCLIDAEFTKVGQTVSILTNGIKVEATICNRLFYDKKGLKTKGELLNPVFSKNTKEFFGIKEC